jgi:hypothetical protein
MKSVLKKLTPDQILLCKDIGEHRGKKCHQRRPDNRSA